MLLEKTGIVSWELHQGGHWTNEEGNKASHK